MKHFTSILLLFLLTLALPVMAQERDKRLTIEVTSVEGDNLYGQKVNLVQTDYEVSYGTLTLNGQGTCALNVYAGNHRLTIERDGFDTFQTDFAIEETETERTVRVELKEKTRNPFALKAEVAHDVFTGVNSITLNWNQEAPAFFDDFESYDPFSIEFGEWTGIDADNEAAAPLIGVYPNRGVMQYAQIINPLTVDPTWWYDYPILRPYSGQQYVGFTRTSSGNANDDWLISPAITVGTDNILTFMGKAADQFAERFMVYVTTKLDQPVQEDFVRIDKDNYETADYKGWKQYTYDLSAYAGQQIKFAIRYVSDYNRYRSFMLMIDDVYVGQQQAGSRRAMPRKSMANPNETFHLFLDGEQVGTTDAYTYVFQNVTGGTHELGVQATYIKAQSQTATLQVTVPAEAYSHVIFRVTADSKLSADGQKLSVTSLTTSETYELTVSDGQAEVASLPNGSYVLNIAEGAFNEYQQTITVSGDATFTIDLKDHILAPYNITATADEQGIFTLRWNQELIFSDSFEDYDDFATGSFGEWKSVDQDEMPVYPVALGNASNIVSFPGSGTASKPLPIAPMVFNPWHTTPAMMPTDPAIAAPTGDKTVIFFSAQQTRNDKWLISPLLNIHEDYKLSLKAKAYSSMYPESLEFCVSEGGDQPADFSQLSVVETVSAEQWTLYETDLSRFAGQTIRLAVHYTSYDAFLLQVDDFTVGPENGQGEIIDYGNVVRFEISLDGQSVGQSESPVFVLPPLSEGEHVVGIKAVYQSGESEVVEYTFTYSTGIAAVRLDPSAPMSVYNLSGMYVGQQINDLPRGVYFVKQHGRTIKMSK